MIDLQRVREFNNTDLKVYDYLIKNYATLGYMTIREFAAACDVSTTTILRFCHKVGYKNYSDFKRGLKAYLDSHPQGSAVDLAQEARGFFTLINNDEMDRAIANCAEKIKSKKNIVFVGTGISGIMAKYGARYLSSTGKMCFYIDDATFPVSASAWQGDIALVLSVSGESPPTLEIAAKLKSSGCEVIAITSDIRSPLAQMADSQLCYFMKQTRIEEVINITSQMPVIYIIESLSKAVMSQPLAAQS